LAAQRRALEEERRQWESHQAESEPRTAALQDELERQQRELQSQRQALEDERQNWEVRRAEIEEELRARRDELDAWEERQRVDRAAYEEQRRQAEATPADGHRCRDEEPSADDEPQVQSEPIVPQSPLRAEDILRRMGMMPAFSEQDDEPKEPQRPPQPPRAVPSSQHHPQSDGDSDDESIEDYMSRLLNRVRSVAGDAPASSGTRRREPSRSSAPASSESSTRGKATDTPEPQAAHPKGQESVEMSPRTVAPEKSVDLSAMRELANLSAQTAIDRHRQRAQRGATLSKLVVALVGLAAGAVLLHFWRHHAPTRLTFGAAMTSFVVAACWGVQYLILAVRRIGRSSPLAKAPCEKPDAEPQVAGKDC